jgi:hypothetical protein
MSSFGSWTAAALCSFALIAPPAAIAQVNKPWTFDAAIYGYFPTISGKTTFPATGGSSSVSVDIDTIIDHLKFAFMGSFEARKGRWSAYTDLVYLDVDGSKAGARSLALGGVVPTDATTAVDFDLKGWVWTLAGTYRFVADTDFTTDVVFGLRQLDVTPRMGWQFGGAVGSIPLQDRGGSREQKLSNWDAIVGIKGRASFLEGAGWFLPYYFDIGTGGSRFTWQVMAGVGYAFGWGDVVGAWRHIDYEMKSGDVIENLAFNGPAIAAMFHW